MTSAAAAVVDVAEDNDVRGNANTNNNDDDDFDISLEKKIQQQLLSKLTLSCAAKLSTATCYRCVSI